MGDFSREGVRQLKNRGYYIGGRYISKNDDTVEDYRVVPGDIYICRFVDGNYYSIDVIHEKTGASIRHIPFGNFINIHKDVDCVCGKGADQLYTDIKCKGCNKHFLVCFDCFCRSVRPYKEEHGLCENCIKKRE